MLIIQFTGLSGAGKTTIANLVKQQLNLSDIPVQIIDGDHYRKTICSDLGFSKEDRAENIRRLGKVAHEFSKQNIITILSAINPYEEIRQELTTKYRAKTVFIDCDLKTLLQRDTKGLYQRAYLPNGHPNKLHCLTGVNDPYEVPLQFDLILQTYKEGPATSSAKLCQFIMNNIDISP
ncbi:adenylylsulfate kinase [Pedobacter sp. AK017]|uniref:adenylyl-sulfate kinase n=1 Tax=Pedobacter sp. AK017 TaxID=2723073 RepID=UPI001620B986|nr:adenylyl-sulfate kinase [Pedobacter sp. AK017]MBB5440696.1 adenylylsulfate kinase [Pedobacter sp. AK017]